MSRLLMNAIRRRHGRSASIRQGATLTASTDKTHGDSMDPTEAQQFYADPENQVPAGQAYRRTGPRLSATVPVRFPQAVIDAVKRLADRDGVTVSSWIRRLVTEEMMRRQPAAVTEPSQVPRFESLTGANLGSATDSSIAPDRRIEVDCFA
jgi:hypothetical protein